MTVQEALRLIRGLTGHSDGNPAGEAAGADTALGADQFLITLVDQEIKQLRRRITDEAPGFYDSTAQTTLTAGVSTTSALTAVGDYESILRVERTDDGGNTWRPVPMAGEPWVDQPFELSWHEQGAGILMFSPPLSAPGTYRFTYRTKQTPDPVVAGTTIAVPSGFELIVVWRVIAQVRPRLDEDGVTPDQRADKMWLEQIGPLKNRHGHHVIPGFRPSEKNTSLPGPANFWRL